MTSRLDITSDVESIADETDQEEENTFNGEEEETTPARSGQSTSHRLSMSQPVLSANSRSRLPTAKQSSMSSLHLKQGIPLMATYEENERLKLEMAGLRGKLENARYMEREIRDQMPRPVQDIMDEFYAMKLTMEDYEENKEELENLQKKLEQAELATEKAKREAKEQTEKARIEVQQHLARIRELEEELNGREPPLSDRFAMSSAREEDFTLSSENGNDAALDALRDELIESRRETAKFMTHSQELEKELDKCRQEIAGMMEKSAVAKSFAIGHGQAEMDLIGRVDELEKDLEKQRNNEKKYRAALHSYMNRVTKLERELLNWNPESPLLNGTNTSQQNLTYDVQNGEELRKAVEQLSVELKACRAKNVDLRRQCAALTGGVVDLSMTCDDEAIQAQLKQMVQQADSSLAQDVDNGDLNDTSKEIDDVCDRVKNMFAQIAADGWDINTTVNNLPTSEGADVAAGTNTDTNAVDMSSFSVGPALDMMDRSAEMYARLGRPSIANGTFDMNQLNSSISGVLQRSFNTSAEMINVKSKLSDLRSILSMMFYRLKGSAALFEEIVQFLSNGSSSPECQQIAAKIRAMQLNWSKATREADDVNQAVDVAEQSVADLQTQLSLLEHSLNETSFMFDMSRRMTMDHGNSHLIHEQSYHARLSVAAGSTNQAAVTNVSDVPQTESAPTNTDELHAQIDILTRAQMEKNEHIEKLSAQISNLIVESANAKNARDTALSNVELLRKRLDELELAQSQLKIDYAELSSQCDIYRQLNDDVTEQLKEAQTKKQHSADLLASSERETALLHQNVLAAQDKERELLAELRELQAKNDTLTKNADSYEKSIEIMMNEREQKKLAQSQMEAERVQIKNTVESLSRDLKQAVRECEQKDEQLRELEQRAEFAQTQLKEETAAVRENADLLANRVAELESVLAGYEGGSGARSSISGQTGGHVVDISLIGRSTNHFSRGAQTVLTNEGLVESESALRQLHSDVITLNSVYQQLSAAIHQFLDVKPSADESNGENSEAESAAEGCCRLIGLLKDAASHRQQLIDELASHNDKLEKMSFAGDRVEQSSSSPDFAEVELQKTEADPLRYHLQLRQDFYMLTVKAMDLTKNLKTLAKTVNSPIMSSIIDCSRELRNALNDRFLILKVEKENVPGDLSFDDLLVQLKMSEKQNTSLFFALKEQRSKYEELQAKVASCGQDAGMVARISKELDQIAKVMGSAKTIAYSLGDKKRVAGSSKQNT